MIWVRLGGGADSEGPGGSIDGLISFEKALPKSKKPAQVSLSGLL